MKNKKIIIFLLFILIVSICYYIKNSHTLNNKIVVNKQSSNIKFDCNDFSNHFKKTKTITIENNTSNIKVYSLKWMNVDNTLGYQDKFLYEIKCEGSNCNDMGYSQIPVFDFTLFQDIYIEMYSKQKYTITFTYNGKRDEYGYFKGKLVAQEEIANKQKYETYIKERINKIKSMDKVMKKYQKLDDK